MERDRVEEGAERERQLGLADEEEEEEGGGED